MNPLDFILKCILNILDDGLNDFSGPHLIKNVNQEEVRKVVNSCQNLIRYQTFCSQIILEGTRDYTVHDNSIEDAFVMLLKLSKRK